MQRDISEAQNSYKNNTNPMKNWHASDYTCHKDVNINMFNVLGWVCFI